MVRIRSSILKVAATLEEDSPDLNLTCDIKGAVAAHLDHIGDTAISIDQRESSTMGILRSCCWCESCKKRDMRTRRHVMAIRSYAVSRCSTFIPKISY
jgi:hypothetical protein